MVAFINFFKNAKNDSSKWSFTEFQLEPTSYKLIHSKDLLASSTNFSLELRENYVNYRPKYSANLAEYSVSADTTFCRIGRSLISKKSWNMTKVLFLGSQCITRKPQIHLVPRIGDLWSRKIWTPKSAQGNVRCKDSKESNNTL